MKRAGLAATIFLLVIAVYVTYTGFQPNASPAKPALLEVSSPQLLITTLTPRQGHAWGATIHDFDQDGDLDVLVNGHNRNDRIFYQQNGEFHASDFVFNPVSDKHACAAADVDQDGRPDLYCTQGADNGRGRGNNTLWMGIDGMRFRRQEDNHGARDPYGRGRHLTFFRFNRDVYPDLYVTNWSIRNDNLPNDNSVYTNKNGFFTAVESVLNGNQGSRCLDTGDINGDGRDDVVLCGNGAGGSVFQSQGETAYTELTTADETLWWADARLWDLNNDQRLDLVLISGSNHLKVSFHTGDVLFPYSERDRNVFLGEFALGGILACSDETVLATNMAFADIDGEGSTDIYIARRGCPLGEGRREDLTDLILLGPDWRRTLVLPPASAGRAHRVYGARDKFVVLNAGPDWDGDVSVVSRADTQ